jgi:hypothetical protein
LVDAWEWSIDDRILLTLPLHHIHGMVNVIGCALWRVRCDMLPGFDAGRVIERLAAGDLTPKPLEITKYRRISLRPRSALDRHLSLGSGLHACSGWSPIYWSR